MENGEWHTSGTLFLPKCLDCLSGPITDTQSTNDWSWGVFSARRLKRAGLKHQIWRLSVSSFVSRYSPPFGPVRIEATWSYEKVNTETWRDLTVSTCCWMYVMAASSRNTSTVRRRNQRPNKRDWSSGKRMRHHSWLKNSLVMSEEGECATKLKVRCWSCDWWASRNWWLTRLINPKLRKWWEIFRLLRQGICCRPAKIEDISTFSSAWNFNDLSVRLWSLRKGNNVFWMSPIGSEVGKKTV